jgi:hypothetical protein
MSSSGKHGVVRSTVTHCVAPVAFVYVYASKWRAPTGVFKPGFAFGVAYTMEVNGIRLVDWVARLIAGAPVDDVHCQKCRAG